MVWTDALQSLFTFGSVVFIIVLGCISVGGIKEVFQAADEGGRIEFFKYVIQ